MGQKIFGILFLVAALFFAWMFISSPSSHTILSKKRKAPITSPQQAPDEDETKVQADGRPASPIVADIQKLLTQQSELVGLGNNIQRITFKTRLANKQLNSSISNSLSRIAAQNANAPYILEVEVFDTSGPGEKKRKLPTDANGKPIAINKIVFQFSVFEAQAMNKVGEFGATYEASDVAPDLYAQAGPADQKGKKKPDEAKTSSGQN
jgi:hypothetical protein